MHRLAVTVTSAVALATLAGTSLGSASGEPVAAADDALVHAALRAGASGFLLKDAPVEQLVYGIRCVHSGEALVSPSVTRRLLDKLVPPASRPLPPLTERERTVLVQLARGLSNRELAAELHLSEATVKTHVSNLLTKLDLRDRLQAVVLAYESGLVRPGGASH